MRAVFELPSAIVAAGFAACGGGLPSFGHSLERAMRPLDQPEAGCWTVSGPARPSGDLEETSDERRKQEKFWRR